MQFLYKRNKYNSGCKLLKSLAGFT